MWWIWLLSILGAFAAVLAIVAIIGLFIPKSHIATVSAAFDRAPEDVWAMISTPEAQATWAPGVRTIEHLPNRNGHAVWRLVRKRGDSITFEVTEFDPERHRMVTTMVDETQFGGSWTWQIESDPGGGCTLTITEDGEIYNPIFRVVARYLVGYDATMRATTEALREHLGSTTAASPGEGDAANRSPQ